jgi:hypothetical protein
MMPSQARPADDGGRGELGGGWLGAGPGSGAQPAQISMRAPKAPATRGNMSRLLARRAAPALPGAFRINAHCRPWLKLQLSAPE